MWPRTKKKPKKDAAEECGAKLSAMDMQTVLSVKKKLQVLSTFFFSRFC